MKCISWLCWANLLCCSSTTFWCKKLRRRVQFRKTANKLSLGVLSRYWPLEADKKHCLLLAEMQYEGGGRFAPPLTLPDFPLMICLIFLHQPHFDLLIAFPCAVKRLGTIRENKIAPKRTLLKFRANEPMICLIFHRNLILSSCSFFHCQKHFHAHKRGNLIHTVRCLKNAESWCASTEDKGP